MNCHRQSGSDDTPALRRDFRQSGIFTDKGKVEVEVKVKNNLFLPG
jgi:hypothetical protein